MFTCPIGSMLHLDTDQYSYKEHRLVPVTSCMTAT